MHAKTTYASAASLPEGSVVGCLKDGGLFRCPQGGAEWDFRPFGQSLTTRRGRMEKRFRRENAWRVEEGFWSKKELRVNARLHAQSIVSSENAYEAKYRFQWPAYGIKATGFCEY